MSEGTVTSLISAICFIGGLLLGILISTAADDEKLELCAKTHNVYQCEIIAVPTTPE